MSRLSVAGAMVVMCLALGVPAVAQGPAATPVPGRVSAVDSDRPASPAPDTATPRLAVGRAWQRVADRDLVSHPRNGSMYGVISGGPGAVAWGFIYATGPRIWTTADGRDWTSADVETPSDGMPEYPGEVLDVAGGGPAFVAIGSYVPQGRGLDSVALVWTSSDGSSWRLIPDGSAFADSWLTEVVAWEDGFLVYGHENISWDEPGPPRTWASSDGVTWHEVTLVLPERAERVIDIVPASDRLWGLTNYPSTTAAVRARLRRVDSHDGLTWTTSSLRRIGGAEQLHPLPDGLYLTVTRARRPKERAPLGVYRSADSVTWTPITTGRPLGQEIISSGDTLVMIGSKGTCELVRDRCVAAAWRSEDGGETWGLAPVTGTPRWATRAWMTQAAALADGTIVAVGMELKGGDPSTAAWVSVPAAG